MSTRVTILRFLVAFCKPYNEFEAILFSLVMLSVLPVKVFPKQLMLLISYKRTYP